jgi:Transposase DDE domain
MNAPVRKFLCADALISAVYNQFRKIPDPRALSSTVPILFTDVLMSGLAVFGLKFPSLLQYDQNRKTLDDNLRNLYHINRPPSDTYLRERLDELDPIFVRPAFRKIFTELQRGKCLEEFEFLDGHYLLAMDGTGEFSSGKVCCQQCCKKEHKDGSITYYHQMLGACIVHPDQSNVIPLCPEAIQNVDGSEKNDCERNAAKRFIENFKREHPHLEVIILGDGIASNAPYIRLLEKHKMKYLLGAKPGDHQFLFDAVNASEETQYYEILDENGFLHQFRYLNDQALNKSNPDVRVNFLEYRQTDPKGKETNFSWVTNIRITQTNVFALMKGGRARWKIENETFNTLKNLGYNFEHNYGHGQKYLSTILCLLMLLAFLIDQVQGIACSLFRAVKKRAGSFRSLWEDTRVLFRFADLVSWEDLYRFMISGKRMNTS